MNIETFFDGLDESSAILAEDRKLLENIIDIKPRDFCSISSEQIERIHNYILNISSRNREYNYFLEELFRIQPKISNKKVFI